MNHVHRVSYATRQRRPYSVAGIIESIGLIGFFVLAFTLTALDAYVRLTLAWPTALHDSLSSITVLTPYALAMAVLSLVVGPGSILLCRLIWLRVLGVLMFLNAIVYCIIVWCSLGHM